MFASGLVVGIPYFASVYGRTQIIKVPVRSAGMIEMVIDASLHPSRAKRTADIGIKTGSEEEGAEFADIDRLFNRGREYQGVCAGLCMHAISEPGFVGAWSIPIAVRLR